MADITKRTQNWLSSPAAQTVTNNGITIDCDGKGTYHIHGTTTDRVDVYFDITPFTMTVNANIAFYNTAVDSRVVFNLWDGETSIAGWLMNSINRVISNNYSIKNKEVNKMAITVTHSAPSGTTVDMYISPLIYSYPTAIPDTFEPYWKHSLWEMKSATETIQSGDTIYADGQPISTYTIKGNTVQSGTPTPSNPITISGVGNKTANLFDVEAATAGKAINDGTGETISVTGYNSSDYIDVSEFEKISILNTQTYRWGAFYDGSKTYISGFNGYGTKTVPQNAVYVRVTVPDNYLRTFMLNGGDTLLPFEPYGYKIPISNGQASAVNYLGSVTSNREIQKLVLTGEETVAGSAVTGGWIITNLSDSINNTAGVQTAYCSHYEAKENGAMSGLSNGEMCISTQYNNRINFVTSFSSATDFQAYLAQQYANGTPVTVWYVLATPETAAVNEPLMKIGDYSDSISNAVSIPTTEGANTITVDTTVQPSEFTATWTGWHNAYVKELTEQDYTPSPDSFVNTTTDTRDFIRMFVVTESGSTTIDRKFINIEETGEITISLTTTTTYERITVKHSGALRDIPIIVQGNVNGKADDTITFSCNVLGCNPTVEGGLSLDDMTLKMNRWE